VSRANIGVWCGDAADQRRDDRPVGPGQLGRTGLPAQDQDLVAESLRPAPAEATQPLTPPFGPEALSAALSDCHDLDAAAIIQHVTDALNLHSGGWASDDTAIVAIPYRPVIKR